MNWGYLLFMTVSLGVAGLIINYVRERRIKKKKYEKFTLVTEEESSGIVKYIESQVEFSDKGNFPMIVTLILVMMVAGGIVGLFFQNMLIGLMASLALSAYPFMLLIKWEEAQRYRYLQASIPFVSQLSNTYQVKRDMRSAFQSLEGKVPTVFVESYEQSVVNRLDHNVDIHEVLTDWSEQLRSSWIRRLAQLSRVLERRQSHEDTVNRLLELQTQLQQEFNRVTSRRRENKRKKSLLMGGLFMVTIIGVMATRLIDHPYYYFASDPTGRFQLAIFSVLTLLPVSIYFYVTRRRERI